ncbi:hypothetical protein Tco_0611569 [Tanacetum coccineum]
MFKDLRSQFYIGRSSGKFTSRDGESLEFYYSRFYKMMNKLVRNQCHVANHQVNVQFLLQLQPEWKLNTSIRMKLYQKEKCYELNRGIRVQLNAEQADWKDDTDDEFEGQGIGAFNIVHGSDS